MNKELTLFQKGALDSISTTIINEIKSILRNGLL